jgi:hypothetical protein
MKSKQAHRQTSMTALVARFQRSRWSGVRRRIDGMVAGFAQTFYRSDRNAVMTAIRRTVSAYPDRQYTTRGGDQYAKGAVLVRRVR